MTHVSRRSFLETGGRAAAIGALAGVWRPSVVGAAAVPAAGAADWTRFGYDLHNTRFNRNEKTLGPREAARLTPKWTFDTIAGRPIQSPPAVNEDTRRAEPGGH